MGMTLLQAALLEESVDCYDLGQRLFLEPNLASLLETVAENYSPQLMEVLNAMLAIDPLQRPAYHEIQQILDEYWGQQGE